MQRPLLAVPLPRHPFRRDLARAQPMPKAHDDDHDLKLFVLSFTAFFICIYTFIF